MEKSKIKSYGIAAGLFVLCSGVGFFATKALRGSDESSDMLAQGSSVEQVNSPSSGAQSSSVPTVVDKPEGTVDETNTPTVDKTPEADVNTVETSNGLTADKKKESNVKKEEVTTSSNLSVSAPKLVNGKYAFNAKCAGASTYHLYSNGGKTLVKESKNGYFTDILANGTSYVVVAFDSNKKIISKQIVSGLKPTQTATTDASAVEGPKQSYAELTSIINGNSGNYPRGIKINYTNLEGDEEAQQSIANVRNYIKTGIWKSVTVVNATYAGGKVTSLTLQINR